MHDVEFTTKKILLVNLVRVTPYTLRYPIKFDLLCRFENLYSP